MKKRTIFKMTKLLELHLLQFVFLGMLCVTIIFSYSFMILATPTVYNHNATLITGTPNYYPGVYEVQITSNNDGQATIGIHSIAKSNIESGPTQESPAIIMGAAAPFERKIGLAEFTRTDGGTGEIGIYPPYNKFRYKVMTERAPDGTWHNKLSGYDGSYVIIRCDVSEIIDGAPVNSYLHVKIEGNAALMVEMGPGGTTESPTYSDGLGNKTAVYPLNNNAIALKDTSGDLTNKPYIDIILMSSGTLVAGADIGITDPTKPTADFKLKMYVDQVCDYCPEFVYNPTYKPTNPNDPTLDILMMGKYYFDDNLFDGTYYNYPVLPRKIIDKPTAPISSYKIMGSDIELEVIKGDDSGTGSYLNPAFKYWSLKKAIPYEDWNEEPIKLICEVPVLEALNIDGTGYTGAGGRKVILDVNSFDIQIANHKETDAAALTIKNAEMTLKDTFNTTGAELAVGNNAKMVVKEGGTFIIDLSCQLEVEYDAASTTTPSEIQTYKNGVVSIENGGKIINNGVFTIEGTEGKPLASPSVVRDIRSAVLDIQEGGLLENNGCLLSNGELYCMGTIENNGDYNNVIVSQDPDKGQFTYHRGIQVSWKDDVTQDSVYKGSISVGKDKAGNININALVNNNGDIVLVPGWFDCYGKIVNNSGKNIYVCPVDEAIIPITPTTAQPYLVEKRIKFGEPIKSNLHINTGGELTNNGNIKAATVEIINNGRTGTLTSITDPNHKLFKDLILYNYGTTTNNGIIYLDTTYTYGAINNTGNIETNVVVSKIDANEGVLNDSAATKLTNIYNASKTVSGSTNIWNYVPCSGIDVTPGKQSLNGGTIPSWNIIASTSNTCDGTKFLVDMFESVNTNPSKRFSIDANTNTPVTGVALPEINSNIIYNFRVFDYESVYDTVSVTINSSHVSDPTQNGSLIYNGEEQKLITAGGGNGRVMEYKLGAGGTYSTTIPTAKNAGSYTVYYKVATESEATAQSVDVTISKRLVTVSGDDISSRVGNALKSLTYTISGLVAGDTLNGINISTTANNSVVGEYPITVSVTGSNPNYNIITNESVYTITNDDFDVIVKDKYGVFSDDPTYAGFNIDLTVPSNITAYYSYDTPLTSTNYQTVGWTDLTLPYLYATASPSHIMYYYVTNGTDEVKGSKRVIIDKAKQQAPNNVIARAATAKGKGDCWIEKLEPRAMEYRRVDGDGTYKIAYYDIEYVTPGDYLVRRIGDENHYPSPDFLVRVEDGSSFFVEFYKDQDETTPMLTVEIQSAGDLVARPEDPVWTGRHFLDWYSSNNLPFNFNKPVTGYCKIIAFWDDSPPHVHITNLVVATPSTCTEYGNTAYYTCSLCDRWFEDATAFLEIRDRSSVIIEPLGHNWDSGVIIKEATYDIDGECYYTCLRDSSHTKTEVIPRKRKKNSSNNSGSSSDNYASNMNLVNDNNLSDGKWEKGLFGWQFFENGEPVKNEWCTININGKNSKFYFNDNGVMMTGWVNLNNNYYYLWPQTISYEEGQLMVGWQQIDGKWYYLEQSAEKIKDVCFVLN